MTSPSRVFSHIDEVIHHAVHFTGDLTIAQIAGGIGVRHHQLSDGADPTRPQPFHLRWLIPLMNYTKNYEPLKFICRMCGFIAVQLPAVTEGQHVDLAESAGDFMADAADVIQTIAGSLKDRVLTALEREVIVKEIRETKVRLDVLEKLVLAATVVPERGSRAKR